MISTDTDKSGEWVQSNHFMPDSAMKNEQEQAIQQYTVFLLEDDSDDRRQAVHTLKNSPFIYNVHCFDNGDAMIKHFAGEGYYSGSVMRRIPTLIMLDVHVPGTDGLEILKDLKEHPLMKDIPVIILTGDASNRIALDAYKLNADAFIKKPLNLDHIHDVIKRGWSRKPRKSS
jgi:CheY-like chemotaxis protein